MPEITAHVSDAISGLADTVDHALTGERNYEASAGGESLPPGVHPDDASSASEHGPAPDEPGQQHRPGVPIWGTDNDDALPVNQRSAHDWTPQIFLITYNTDPQQIAPRQKGRLAVTLAVPASYAGATPAGVYIAPEKGMLELGVEAWLLNAGDSVTLYTEAPVYAISVESETPAVLQAFTLTNPPGGGRGLSAG